MLKKMTIGGAALLFTALLGSPANAAATAAPSSKVTVDVMTVNGSGCPRGSAAVTELPDNSAFTVSYSDYLAQAGPESAPTDIRKNCQLSLLVHVPQGFTYAIAQADYEGYAYLAPGASGLQQANYYFQGTSQTVPVAHPFGGPFNGDWKNTDRTDAAELVYAPCGVDRILNVNTELRVNAGTSNTTNFITMDSTRGGVHTVYHFQWKQCP